MTCTLPDAFLGGVARMVAARKEHKRCTAINRPVIEYNRPIRREMFALNAELREAMNKGGDAKGVKAKLAALPRLKPWLENPAPWAVKDKKEHIKLQDALRKKKPEQWLRDIMRLKPRMRLCVAPLIWWDYFADRMFDERWTHLDEMIADFTARASDEATMLALVECGYTPFQSWCRVKEGEQ